MTIVQTITFFQRIGNRIFCAGVRRSVVNCHTVVSCGAWHKWTQTNSEQGANSHNLPVAAGWTATKEESSLTHPAQIACVISSHVDYGHCPFAGFSWWCFHVEASSEAARVGPFGFELDLIWKHFMHRVWGLDGWQQYGPSIQSALHTPLRPRHGNLPCTQGVCV